MAATLAGTRLTEAHRVAQARIGVATAARTAAVWPLLDLSAPSAWLDAATLVVEAQAVESARYADAYVRAFRAAELGEVDASFEVAAMRPIDPARVRTSLAVTGPIEAKKMLAAGRVLADAMARASAASAGAAQRHALSAGRQVLMDTAAADPRARGWSRVASAQACAFCLMLASRGPDYTSEGAASFQAHDSCGCTVEPHYRGDGMNPQARRAREMWDTATRGVPSGQQLAAFRAALAGTGTA